MYKSFDRLVGVCGYVKIQQYDYGEMNADANPLGTVERFGGWERRMILLWLIGCFQYRLDPSMLDFAELEECDSVLDSNGKDSDGDGYLDCWEIAEGTDPDDPDDRIYVGNW